MALPPGKPGSYEMCFHEASERLGEKAFFVDLKSEGTRQGPLSEIRGHRAVGVVYHPSYERFTNYVPTSLAHRYDAFVFIDETTALDPLIQGFDYEEIPETWPRGL